MTTRPSGRRADQLRPVRITRNYTKHAEGSVLIEFGDTKVICTASITGAWVAARDAVAKLQAAGLITGNPLKDHVAAISVGIYEGMPVLDLDYPEDSNCDTDMNIVMTGEGHFVEIQGTAEGAAFTRVEMNALLDLAGAGIRDLIGMQKAA